MKKRASAQLKITLNDYTNIIRKNEDSQAIAGLMKIMLDFSAVNSIEMKESINFLFTMNPTITITPDKSEFKIKNICKVCDSFYDHKHYKSLVD
jgi:hypothetical protein